MAAPKGNKFALGLSDTGRPPKYETKEDLIQEVQNYFDHIGGETKEVNTKYIDDNGDQQEETSYLVIKEPENPTLTGLALFLGFSSRQSLYDYKKDKEFSYIIKRATMIIENHHENRLGDKSPTGAIFALKNMGWADKMEVTNTNMDLTPLTDEERKKAKEDLDSDY